MKYTKEQLDFFRECGKKGYAAKLKKYGKKRLHDMQSETTKRVNEKRWMKSRLTKKIV